jgi:hypothetical protein
MIRRAEAMVIKEECQDSLKVTHIAPQETTLKTSGEDGSGATDKGPPVGIDCVRVGYRSSPLVSSVNLYLFHSFRV